MTPRFKYLTVNAFRREFFAAGSRPRKSDVLRWIESGALRGVMIDGIVFIRDDDAVAFFDRATMQSAGGDDKTRVSDRRARVAAARAALAKYGL
jgi:hypothetical protein